MSDWDKGFLLGVFAMFVVSNFVWCLAMFT